MRQDPPEQMQGWLRTREGLGAGRTTVPVVRSRGAAGPAHWPCLCQTSPTPGDSPAWPLPALVVWLGRVSSPGASEVGGWTVPGSLGPESQCFQRGQPDAVLQRHVALDPVWAAPSPVGEGGAGQPEGLGVGVCHDGCTRRRWCQ